MSAPFPFELVSPEKLISSGEVTSVQIPGTEGDFEVLAFHAPVMTSLRPGVLTVSADELTHLEGS
ncbi:MAG: F0F1 ATP synthase subunit epsilon, partial [Pseudomonadota bacterium]